MYSILVTDSTSDFASLGIDPKILGQLERLNIKVPTPIQHKAIPIGLEGKDIIGIAQTGTGKTLAFAIPILQRLPELGGRALIILPTRELAIQVEETFRKFVGMFGLKTAVIIGGVFIGRQTSALRSCPQIIIGTPGRIIDHIKQKTLRLNDVEMLVLDEADRMLDMGFAPQIKQILETVPRDRHTMLFSATMPDNIVKIATTHMKLPVRVEIARSGTTPEQVEQEVFIIKANEKNRLLEALLTQYKGSVLVFTRTKFGARKVCTAVKHMRSEAAEIHSNRSLSQRRDALKGFQDGTYRVLVATDIAARGIDVKGIELVINYDVPEFAEDYVHRIGRTARAGHAGRAITFATPDQSHKIRHIERLIRGVLRVSKLPMLPPDRPVTKIMNSSGHRGSGHSHGGSQYRGRKSRWSRHF